MRGSTPVHPFFLAAFPILFLLAENVGETELIEAAPPLLAALAIAGIALAIGRVVLHDARRAALLVSIGVSGFFLFGHAANLLTTVGLTEGKVLAGWLVAGALAVLVALRTRRDLGGLTVALNVLGVVLVLNSLAMIGLHEVQGIGSAPAPPPASPSPAGLESPRPYAAGSLRDIYYIVVEDYGSQRTVRDTLGLPDDGFFDWLAERGFHVLPDTRSNYGRTPLSLASSLNMTYLDPMAKRFGPAWDDYAPVVDMVRAPIVADFLKVRGYSIVQLGSQFRLTATSPLADVNPVYGDTSDFAGVLYDTTIVPALVHRLGLDDGRDGRRRNYDANAWQLEQFPELTAIPGPKFVFVHLFLPHHPYLVDAAGAYVPRDVDARRTVAEQQAAQWAFVDRELKAMVEPLLAGPDASDPIVIVTTEEGPNPDGLPTIGGDLAWGSATDAQLDQKFSIFAAYYLPGVEATDLYPTMSSVNTFRLVFDLYFDAGLGLLPDRSWIHSDKHHPFDLTDVTDRLDAFQPHP